MPSNPLDKYTSIDEKLERIADILAPKDELTITYPEAGGVKQLESGVAKFNFFEGKVVLPTGITENLSNALSEHGFTHCNSISIDAELPCEIRIDNSGAFTTNAGIPFIRSNIKFKQLTIKTSRQTNVKIYASTSPKALQIEPSLFYSGNPYISNTSIATAGTKNIEDIRNGSSTINGASRDDSAQALGKNAHSGYIYNLGPGDLSIEFNDGTGYSNAETLKSNLTRDLEGMDISKIRIDATIDATEYYLGAQ